MGETPPPLAETDSDPDTFRLPLIGWILWGIYAALRLFAFFSAKVPFDAGAFGELMGGIVAMLIIPTLLAWAIWRVAGRKAMAGHATFLVLLVFLVLGQLGRYSAQARFKTEIERLTTEQKQVLGEQRKALSEGKHIDTTKSEAFVTKASDQFNQLAQNTTGREHNIAEAGKEYMDELLAAKHRYDAAAAALHVESFWSLTRFTPGPPAEERRKNVRAFAQANAELATYQDVNATALRRIIAAHGGSSAEVDQAVQGYMQSAGTRLPFMAKIRETDAQLAQAMLDFLDLAQAAQGKWRIDPSTGKLVFTDTSMLKRYNEVLKRVKDISAAQLQYQRRALTP